MKNNLKIATCYQDTIRIYICDTTELVEEARKLHKLWPTSAAALGRTLTVVGMMGAMLKKQQSLAVKIDATGPIKKIVAEADESGSVIGYVGNPEIYLKYDNGKLNVAMAVGEGSTLTVTKDLFLKEPFTSISPIVSGEIAEDFTYYFATSEQVPTSVALGVLVGTEGTIEHAGGFIVQVMPGASEETIQTLETTLSDFPSFTTLLEERVSLEEIISKLSAGEYQILEERHLHFACSCSKQRFREGIMSLGAQTIETILSEDKEAECTCQYCGKQYVYDEDDLISMLNVVRRLKK